ncbi:MAG: hypothetical protein SPI77_07510 [Corynebacterium sp.]|nr:hypothetical protein [Corynebacterium sp.]
MTGTDGKTGATSEPPRRFKIRFYHLVILFLAVGVCLTAAWWQWARFKFTGSLQNLGYVAQWPVFGAFLLWGYKRYVDYENELLESGEESPVEREIRTKGIITAIDEDFLPTQVNTDVEAFNKLATRTRREVRDNLGEQFDH